MNILKKAQFAWYFDEESKKEIKEKAKDLGLDEIDGGINKLENSFSFTDEEDEEKESITLRGYIISLKTTKELKDKKLDLDFK